MHSVRDLFNNPVGRRNPCCEKIEQNQLSVVFPGRLLILSFAE